MEKIHIVRKSQKRSIRESQGQGWRVCQPRLSLNPGIDRIWDLRPAWAHLCRCHRERAGWGRWHHTSRGSCRTHNERKCASNKRAVPRHWKQHDNLIINRRESTKLRSLRRPGLADYASGKWHSCANFKWLKEGPKPHKPWAFCQGSCFIRGFVCFCICTQILHFFPFSFLDCFAHCGD